MTVAEQLEARGEAKGIALGIRQNQEEVAINLLKEGADLNFVVKITKLELAEVERLQADLGSY